MGITLCACALGVAGIAAAQSVDTHAVPDLSGHFSHGTSLYSPPAHGGPGPLSDYPDYLHSGHGPGQGANAWVGDYDNPMLKPHTAAEVKRLGELELSGGVNLSAFQLCQPLGVPLVLTQRENIQVLQQPDQVTIIYQRDHLIRRVHLNVAHSRTAEPSWYGDSVGHYEGNTLVVDTIGQNGKSRVDRYGSFGSDQLHVIERYHLADDGQTLQVDFTVEDPNSFNTSWNATQYYPRSSRGWDEVICAENNRDAKTGVEYEGVPVAAKMDF